MGEGKDNSSHLYPSNTAAERLSLPWIGRGMTFPGRL